MGTSLTNRNQDKIVDVVERADEKNALCVDVSSDIQIGAVEIKDGDSDLRADVKDDGTDNALVVTMNEGGSGEILDTDDDDIENNQTLPLKITENYVHYISEAKIPGDLGRWLRWQATADGAAYVNITNEDIAVTATDLDIRNIVSTQDNIAISTPAGDSAMDDTNDVLLVGVKGSVGYNNTSDVFKNLIYGLNSEDSLPYGVPLVVPGTTIFGNEKAIPVAFAFDETSDHYVTLKADTNQWTLLTTSIDTNGVKEVFNVDGSSNVTESNLTAIRSDNSIGVSGARKSLQEHFEAITGWVENAGADNIATTTTHQGTGNNNLTFDKINGNVDAMISKTIASVDMSEYSMHSIGHMHVYLSDLTDVVNVFVRLGTDASNYHQWNFPVADLTVGFIDLDTPISQPDSQTGAGYDLSAITWIAFGVTFGNSTDTLGGIITGNWGIKRVLDIYQIATVSTEVNVPNVNVTKMASKPVSMNIGNSSTGTQRVVLASDQPSVTVDGAVTVSGTVTANAGTNLNTSLLATSAKQLADGHNVTVDNGAGASAVNIQDGGNTITVDGAVTVSSTNLDIRDLAPATDGILMYGYDYASTNYKLQVTSGGEIFVNTVSSLDAIGAGDTTIGGVMISGGDGAKNDTSLTLTNATTAYSNTAPATPHLLIVHNASDTDVYWRFTTGTTLGTKLATLTSMAIDMGASEVLYFYCGSAGKVINYSTRCNF